MSDTPSALDLATEDELIAELRKRSTGLVLLRHKEVALDATGDSTFTLDWFGGLTLAVGLVQRASCRFAHLVCCSSTSSNDRRMDKDP